MSLLKEATQSHQVGSRVSCATAPPAVVAEVVLPPKAKCAGVKGVKNFFTPKEGKDVKSGGQYLPSHDKRKDLKLDEIPLHQPLFIVDTATAINLGSIEPTITKRKRKGQGSELTAGGDGDVVLLFPVLATVNATIKTVTDKEPEDIKRKKTIGFPGKKVKKGKDTDDVLLLPQPPFSSAIPTTSPQCAAITLTDGAVILVEDVDIFFEEDKGFWAALLTLIRTTKNPIIMTTNLTDLDLVHLAKVSHLTQTFARPNAQLLLKHARILCTTEHGAVIPIGLPSWLEHIKGDIRQTFLGLQLWCHTSSSVLHPGRPLFTGIYFL